MLSNLISVFTNNPYTNLFLGTITVLSFLYAIKCQHDNKRIKRISYVLKSKVFIYDVNDLLNKITILYGNEVISNLSVSHYAIWNSGNQVLNAFDIVKKESLNITISDKEKILGCKIAHTTDDSNDFKVVKENDNKIKLSFDYINVNDGVILQIIHTGDKDCVHINGKIKGGSITNAYPNSDISLTKYEFSNIPKLTLIFIISLFYGIAQFIFYIIKYTLFLFNVIDTTVVHMPQASNDELHIIIWMYIVVVILEVIFLKSLISDLKKTALHKMPKKLKDKFYE